MPRYFFEVYDGERHSRDDEGIELPDVSHVWKVAAPMVDDIAKTDHGGCPSRTISVVVRDVRDVVVYTSDFVGR